MTQCLEIASAQRGEELANQLLVAAVFRHHTPQCSCVKTDARAFTPHARRLPSGITTKVDALPGEDPLYDDECGDDEPGQEHAPFRKPLHRLRLRHYRACEFGADVS